MSLTPTPSARTSSRRDSTVAEASLPSSDTATPGSPLAEESETISTQLLKNMIIGGEPVPDEDSVMLGKAF